MENLQDINKDSVVALIDSDIYCYEVGCIQMLHPFLKNAATVPASETKIEEVLDTKIANCKEAVGATHVECFLTGKGNFREEVADLEPYKGHRKADAKPFHFQTVKDLLLTNYNADLAEGHEADDSIILRKRELEALGIRAIICSRDKDLRGEGGEHYSWSCGEYQPEKPLYDITQNEGTKWFYTQLLTGDDTDNILGCGQRVDKIYGPKAKKAGQAYRKRVGVGPKSAKELLQSAVEEEDLFRIICGEYIKQFGDKAEARLLEMGKLLYIGQTYDNQWELPYDFGT